MQQQMEDDRVTDELLDLIRKELTAIIDEKPKANTSNISCVDTVVESVSSRMTTKDVTTQPGASATIAPAPLAAPLRTSGGMDELLLLSATEPLKGEITRLGDLSLTARTTHGTKTPPSTAGRNANSVKKSPRQAMEGVRTPRVNTKTQLSATKQTAAPPKKEKVSGSASKSDRSGGSTPKTERTNVARSVGMAKTQESKKSSIVKRELDAVNADIPSYRRMTVSAAAAITVTKPTRTNERAKAATQKLVDLKVKKSARRMAGDVATKQIKADAAAKQQNPVTVADTSTSTAALGTPPIEDINPYHTYNVAANRTNDFLDSQACRTIDDDLQRMQMELKKSYELFQSIGEKFEAINFGNIQNRIRDLHLNATSNVDLLNGVKGDLHQVFEKRFVDNELDKLKSDAGAHFRSHPGEFADIPELSAFFQTCSQLEHGLQDLKKQRLQSNELEKRMCWATEIAYDRMDEIRNSVGASPSKNF